VLPPLDEALPLLDEEELPLLEEELPLLEDVLPLLDEELPLLDEVLPLLDEELTPDGPLPPPGVGERHPPAPSADMKVTVSSSARDAEGIQIWIALFIDRPPQTETSACGTGQRSVRHARTRCSGDGEAPPVSHTRRRYSPAFSATVRKTSHGTAMGVPCRTRSGESGRVVGRWRPPRHRRSTLGP
jgi:hypothetical protein